MTTVIQLNGGHQFIDTFDVVTVIGTDGMDSVSLGPKVAQATVFNVEAVQGSNGFDTLILGSSTGFLTVSGVENIIGSSGYDTVALTGSQDHLTVTGVESLIDLSGGVQTAYLTGSTAFLTVTGIEMVYGDQVSGSSTIVLGDGQADIAVQSVDQVIGNSLENTVYVNSGNKPLHVSGIEHVVGNQSSPDLILGDGGNTTTVSNIGTVIGGLGYDAVTLVGSQHYITVNGVEFLGAGAGFQVASVAGSFAFLTVNGVEAVYGTSQDSFVSVTLGDEQTSLTIGFVDEVIGNNHDNTLFINNGFVKVSNIEHVEDGFLDLGGTTLGIALGDGGNTLSVTSIETIVGGAGYDAVTETMYSSNNQISGVESFTATGGGYHSVSVTGSIANLSIQGVSSLTGDEAYQSVRLDGSSAHITIAGIDALYGTAQSDTITVSAGPAVVIGGAGADAITLSGSSWDASSQIVAFASDNDGSAGGINSGFDTIGNFDAANDKIAIQSDTPLFAALDKNGAGLAVASRAKDGVDMSGDEIVVLTTAVSGSLTDSGYQNFRTALGSVANDQAASVVVAATNGTDTGIYLVHSDHVGGIGAAEVSLLGLVSGTTGMTASNFITVPV